MVFKYLHVSGSIALIRAGIMKAISFRAGHIMNIIGNLIYMIIVFFLWKAIFMSSLSATINGMTFIDTVVYLMFANALYRLMDANLVWDIGEDIRSGAITMDLIKPMSYPLYTFFKHAGNYIIAFLISFFPTFLICVILFEKNMVIGYNLIFFLISMIIGLLINFCIDFLVGMICIFTQSIWGINILKEVVVSILSGALVPLNFYPDWLLKVVNLFPFQAIYHTTIQFLTNDTMQLNDYLFSLLRQLMWLFIILCLSGFCWSRIIHKLTINGG